MIIEENILVGINSKNIKHFKDLGYDVKVGVDVYVLSTHLCKNSSYTITVKCDKCEYIKKIKMKVYTESLKSHNFYCCKSCSKHKNILTNIQNHGVEHTFQNNVFLEKRSNNNIKKYGVPFTSQIDIVKEKIKRTNLLKYGVEYASQNKEVNEKKKTTRINLGLQLPDHKVSPFLLYKRIVKNITNKNKNDLLNEWNGYDYYDNEYIKDNFSLSNKDRNYPSVDHKISIWYGFKNEIPPEIIGDISNLCITKIYINSSKNIRNENEFFNH